MTHYVLRSKVSDPAAFQTRVKAHCAALTVHEAHMTKVRLGVKDHQACPSPTQGMDPEIDACVQRASQPNGSCKFSVDYELVDYLPVANDDRTGLILRKKLLAHDLGLLQEASVHCLFPSGKWRYAGLLFNQASAKPEAARTAADNDLITEHIQRRRTLELIHLHYARQESEVEDLDFDSVNSFRPQPFKG